MKTILLVAIGGAAGSVLRFGVGSVYLHLYSQARLPLATLTVNTLGCVGVGLIVAVLERVSFFNSELRLLLISGFLGGFTTFSAFGLETLFLFRDGQHWPALLNMALNLALGIGGVAVGLLLGGALGKVLE